MNKRARRADYFRQKQRDDRSTQNLNKQQTLSPKGGNIDIIFFLFFLCAFLCVFVFLENKQNYQQKKTQKQTSEQTKYKKK